MAGNIEVAMEREPDYFLGAALHSPRARTVVARDRDGGVAASAGISERPVYVDGRPREVAFLSDVRIHPRHRRGTLLGRMIRFVREQGWLDGGFAQTIVVRDNRAALDLLGSPKAGAPRFFPAGEYASPAVFLGGRLPSLEGRFRVRRAGPEDLPAMQAFLEREAPSKQFHPCYDLRELGTSPYYRGLAPDSFYLAFEGGGESGEGGGLAGIAGVWDQRGCKQTRIVGYHGAVRMLRPAYNLVAPLLGRPGLPGAGSLLPSLFLHTACVQGNDPEIFSVLLRRIHNDQAGLPYTYLLGGFDVRDPLLRVLRGYPHQDFGGRHFLLSFDGEPPAGLSGVDAGRFFYLEAARI